MKKMNSINETARLCKENEIGISRNHIIQLAKSGAVPSVKINQKTLINWDGLMKCLDNSTLVPDKPQSGIRRISV